MKDFDRTVMMITMAIAAFGETDRGGAVKLANELRDAVTRMARQHEARIAGVIAKARRQNDRAWNAALDAAWHELEMELGNGERRAPGATVINRRVDDLMDAWATRLDKRRRQVRS